MKLWGEYERVSKGRRALTWSVGLRGWACLEEELSDEEVAEQERQAVILWRFLLIESGRKDVLLVQPSYLRWSSREASWKLMNGWIIMELLLLFPLVGSKKWAG